ncbi:Por secretion system C-terminal sorting domain-containing protein [Aquiflexum balticum DSM 16537]|uniref:Por secretion system C-terminal sorting domain-containing protein n=1 Tax=Aquiflexum balticum DSM 16537 TaxID=758820 RepID=A0A1W2H6Z0_9BACT|nr:S8 family serine peptidase [Aquiflexum balticum]SMD44683.1 Por secretion system C-terminal sorting domain-containing protein [Aquiflexum balticum DSM 16537]
MGNFRNLLFITFLVGLSFSVFGQNRYAVHFKFKPQESYSLSNPSDFLTQKSIERRERQQIAMDSLDLPVSQKYLEQLESSVNMIFYSSHWLNAAIVSANPENIASISELPFVREVNLIAPGDFSQRKSDLNPKGKAGLSSKSTGKSNKTESSFDFQNQLLGIQEMHEAGFKGKGVTIAVFDAGFPGVDKIGAFSHLFDNNQLIGTKDFVHVGNNNVFSKHQHGTNVLSLIASNQEDLLIAGAPESDYILCITEDVPTEYRIEEYNWVKAAEYADSLGVDIINSSVGYWDFDDPSMNYTIEDLDGETAVVTKGATIAGNKGILIVTSAGNYGSRGTSSLTVPADANGILAIGSVNDNFSRSIFSSQGPTADGRVKPEVSAFGDRVWLLNSNGTLIRSSGTSFSSPQIAALAAGIWQGRPEWTKDELLENILRSASQTENPDNLLGFGIPDFKRAYFGEILSTTIIDLENNWKIYPNPVYGSELFLNFGNQLVSELSIIDMHGNLVKKETISRQSIQKPFEVSLPMISSGIYMVQMQSGKDVKRTKLMKR